MLAPPPRAGDFRKSAGLNKVIVPEEDTRGDNRSRSKNGKCTVFLQGIYHKIHKIVYSVSERKSSPKRGET
jgi:hypothetical protein